MKKSMATRQGKRNAAIAECATTPAGAEDITIDRRLAAERRDEEAKSTEAAAAPKLERRQKVNRRRQIDPTTCERDYTDLEVEFMNALDDYKRNSGRMFPTCSEVLEVIQSLGYVKLSATQIMTIQATNPVAASAKPMPLDLQVAEVAAAVEQLV
jgi:hypothetical protein